MNLRKVNVWLAAPSSPNARYLAGAGDEQSAFSLANVPRRILPVT